MKKIKKLLFLFIILFCIVGCTNAESTLTINSDRSMDLDIKILVDSKFNETNYLGNTSLYDERNLKIQRITQGDLKGYRITKEYANIDDLSSDKSVTLDITKFLEPNYDEKTIFKLEKSYFKNKYSASFNIDFDYLRKNLFTEKKGNKDDFVNKIKSLYNKAISDYSKNKKEKVYSDEKNELEIEKNIKYEISVNANGKVTKIEFTDNDFTYKKESENILVSDINVSDVNNNDNSEEKNVFKFILKLPNKTVSNNATTVSGSGETLTWIFDKNSMQNNISFVFELDNNGNYLSVVGIGLLIILSFVILIVLSIKINNKRREKKESEPIYKSYDLNTDEVSKENELTNESVQVIEEETNIDNSVQVINETEKVDTIPQVEIKEQSEIINIDDSNDLNNITY